MKNIILFDDDTRVAFLPLSYTRPMADFRVGILSIGEKWARRLNGTVSYITQDYLSGKFPIQITEDNYVINSSILPNDQIVQLVENLTMNEAYLFGSQLLAVRLDSRQFEKLLKEEPIDELRGSDLEGEKSLDQVSKLWHLFQKNGDQIRLDYELITKNRRSAPLSSSNKVVGNPKDVFLEPGAVVEAATINTKAGPVYIGKNAEVMEGAMIRGPFALCDHGVIKMGAKIYGDSTVGPYSKVGGEIHNAVFFGYSNKAHDGFLGNAVIGEWCNIGADTNNSNLKNNYAEVKLWDYKTGRFVLTGTQFCGLIMGDHSKAGINVMFNTGTVVGCSANIFGDGYPRNFIPSFSWGGAAHYQTFQLEKAFEVAEAVMKRRAKILEEEDRSILEYIFNASAKYRPWEHK